MTMAKHKAGGRTGSGRKKGMFSNPGVYKGHAGYIHEGSLSAARKTQVASGKETELPRISSWHRQGFVDTRVNCYLKDVALLLKRKLVLCLYFLII